MIAKPNYADAVNKMAASDSIIAKVAGVSPATGDGTPANATYGTGVQPMNQQRKGLATAMGLGGLDEVKE